MRLQSNSVLLAAALCLGLQATNSRADLIYTYSFSSTVWGFTGVDLCEYPGSGGGGFKTYFSTLTEKLYYDPAAGTLRHVGTLTASPWSGSFVIWNSDLHENRGSATLTVGNNGVFSYDRTDRVQSSSKPFSYGDLLVPVHGIGTYLGQHFEGDWFIRLFVITDILEFSPTSLTLSQCTDNGPYTGSAGEGEPVGVSGLINGVSDGMYYYGLTIDPVVARAVSEVPETASTLLLSGIGFVALLGLKKWRRKTA